MPWHAPSFSRFSALTIGLLSLAPATWADTFHLKVLYNGVAVGQNDFSSSPDGSFDSKTVFKLGTIDLGSTLSGHLVAGKLADYAFDGSTGTAARIKMTFAKGQLAVDAQGKKLNAPFEDKTGILFGALHPQFARTTLVTAEKALHDKPEQSETVVSAFMLEGGALIPLKVRALPVRKVKVGDHELTARRFNAHVGTVDIEYAIDDANHVVAMDVPTQKIRMIADGWDGLFIDPLAKYPELSQPTYKFKTEAGVKMKTRDGVELVSDVVRPDDSDRHPTILVRTPYGRGGSTAEAGFWAARGYCYVAQDCRGREDSGGVWDPFINEGPDGYHAIQWVAKQPWSDGKVGMIGGSYVGYVQWAAATLNPPALKCIVPQVSPPDAMHNIPYEYGTFFLYGDLWWSKIVEGKKADMSGVGKFMNNLDKFATLPLQDVDKAVLGQHVEFFQKWLSRETLPAWKGFDYTEHMAASRVPALQISGNWDGDGIGTHLNWEAMRKLGRTDQWIIFGPWTHNFNTTHSLGDVEYGPDAILELDSVYLRWFDTWLKGKSVGQEKVPHVKLFVTGANKWIETSNWPTTQMPERSLFLSKDSLAAKPGPAEKAEYTYDPAKDTNIPDVFKKSPDAVKLTLSPKELSEPGVVFLKSEPLKKSTAITGPFQISLHFTCSAVNTDFFGEILDVAPDGSAQALGQGGKIRCSYLDGTGKVKALVPGKEYVAKLVPWQFAHEFAPGHRIGIAIRSSSFPMFARNLGTIDPIKTATRMVAQHNTILMGKAHESQLSFHVIWEK